MVITNADPHQNVVISAPTTTGPSEENPAPIPDQSAMAKTCCLPLNRAEIRDRVVGKAMPAAKPPMSRARISTSMLGAQAARADAGMQSAKPATSINRRPYRSASAPR